MNTDSTPDLPGIESLVQPFKFQSQPHEYKVTALRECPTPDAMQTCDTPDKIPSYNEKLVDDYWVLPDLATSLKTGNVANNYQVTAIVTKAGKMFSNGKPAILARFDQRKFEPSLWPNYTVVYVPKPKE